ncbi:hypothetical protein PAEPH01_2811 [Pancytospora epiphaga]|nr:hypothetical protein PAEPH01_2811 [Pancytospora epiphaga]
MKDNKTFKNPNNHKINDCGTKENTKNIKNKESLQSFLDSPYNYTITPINESEILGWAITIYGTSDVRYRILTGDEQSINEDRSSLYLSIIVKKKWKGGIKFKCKEPRISQTVNKKNKTTLIKLLIIKP